MASQVFAHGKVYFCVLLLGFAIGLADNIDEALPPTTTLKIERRLVARAQNGTRTDTGASSAPASSTRAQAESIASASDTVVKSSMTFMQSLSTEPLRDVHFTSAPLETGIAEAEQCWSDIMVWRNSSASWYNTHIANRTWPLGSTSETGVSTWASTSTYYPANVSIYTLCDGTPRANVRPITSHWSGTDTYWNTFSAIITPTFRPQPCDPSPEMCRLWYYESNIKAKDEQELIRQCGKPAHAGAPCLIGGGPVQLYYFPVTPTSTTLLCGSNTTANTTHTPTPAPTTLPPITTHNHTFSPQSAYISFRTLYASYDGFWDRLGPQFSDFIFPLASSEISTHCGGWWKAFGHGTQLDYADLNWPVPASAYKCQNRCSSTYTSDCETCTWYHTSDVQHCGTIWSDVDPVLAVPTRVRELAPEWKECRFWDEDIPNFWFDPPVALQQGEGQAMPTTPHADPVTTTKAGISEGVEPTTEAAPSSKNVGTLPTKTGAGEGSDAGTTVAVPEETQDAGPSAPSVDSDGSAPDPSNEGGNAVPSGDESDPQSPTSGPDPPQDGPPDPSQGPKDIAPTAFPNEPADTNVADPGSVGDPSSQDQGSQDDPDTQNNNPNVEDPQASGVISQPPNPSPSPVNAPALSILASALDSAGPSIDPSVQSLISSAHGAAESVLHPSPAPTMTDNDELPSTKGAVTFVTLGHTTLAISQISAAPGSGNGQGGYGGGEVEGEEGDIVIGSSLTLSAGQTTTVSGVPVAVYISAILWGSTFVPLPEASEASGGSDGAAGSTLAFEGMTLTAVPAAERGGASGVRALSIGDTTISPGGPAAVLDGTTISHASDGEVVVYGEQSTGTMTRVSDAGSETGTSSGARGGLPDITAGSATSSASVEGTLSSTGTDGDGNGGGETSATGDAGPAITTVGSSAAGRTGGALCSSLATVGGLGAVFWGAIWLLYI